MGLCQVQRLEEHLPLRDKQRIEKSSVTELPLPVIREPR